MKKNSGFIQLPVIAVAVLLLAAVALPVISNFVAQNKKITTQQRATGGAPNCSCTPTLRSWISDDPDYCRSTYSGYYSNGQFACVNSYSGGCNTDDSWKIEIGEDGKCYSVKYYCGRGGSPPTGNCSGVMYGRLDETNFHRTRESCIWPTLPEDYCFADGLNCTTGQSNNDSGHKVKWENNKCYVYQYSSNISPTPTIFSPTAPPTPTEGCRIQGFKVVMPENKKIDPASSQEVYCLSGSEQYKSTSQPYSFSVNGGESNSCQVTVPSGYSLSYSYCANRIDCHSAVTPVIEPGSYYHPDRPLRINCPTPLPGQTEGYIDLWWHYTPFTPTPTQTPVPLSCNESCDVTTSPFCARGLFCHVVLFDTGYCRNPSCRESQNCLCSTPTPTPFLTVNFQNGNGTPIPVPSGIKAFCPGNFDSDGNSACGSEQGRTTSFNCPVLENSTYSPYKGICLSIPSSYIVTATSSSLNLFSLDKSARRTSITHYFGWNSWNTGNRILNIVVASTPTATPTIIPGPTSLIGVPSCAVNHLPLVTLTWSDMSQIPNFVAYYAYRCAGANCIPNEQSENLVSGGSRYVVIDSDVVSSTVYGYRVKAQFRSGSEFVWSGYSQITYVTTPSCATSLTSTPTPLASSTTIVGQVVCPNGANANLSGVELNFVATGKEDRTEIIKQTGFVQGTNWTLNWVGLGRSAGLYMYMRPSGNTGRGDMLQLKVLTTPRSDGITYVFETGSTTISYWSYFGNNLRGSHTVIYQIPSVFLRNYPTVCPASTNTPTPTPVSTYRFDVLIFDDNPYPLRRVDSIACAGFDSIGAGSIKVDGTVTGFSCSPGLQNGKPGGFPAATNIPHVRGNGGVHNFGINLPSGYEVVAWKAYSESCATGSTWLSCKQTPEARGTGANTTQITFNKDYVVEFVVKRTASLTPSATPTPTTAAGCANPIFRPAPTPPSGGVGEACFSRCSSCQSNCPAVGGVNYACVSYHHPAGAPGVPDCYGGFTGEFTALRCTTNILRTACPCTDVPNPSVTPGGATLTPRATVTPGGATATPGGATATPPAGCSCPAGKPAKISGNADCNGVVDRQDLVLWMTQFANDGRVDPDRSANFDCATGSTVVNRQDLGLWINGFADPNISH